VPSLPACLPACVNHTIMKVQLADSAMLKATCKRQEQAIAELEHIIAANASVRARCMCLLTPQRRSTRDPLEVFPQIWLRLQQTIYSPFSHRPRAPGGEPGIRTGEQRLHPGPHSAASGGDSHSNRGCGLIPGCCFYFAACYACVLSVRRMAHNQLDDNTLEGVRARIEEETARYGTPGPLMTGCRYAALQQALDHQPTVRPEARGHLVCSRGSQAISTTAYCQAVYRRQNVRPKSWSGRCVHFQYPSCPAPPPTPPPPLEHPTAAPSGNNAPRCCSLLKTMPASSLTWKLKSWRLMQRCASGFGLL
jgi:hypothetical protein